MRRCMLLFDEFYFSKTLTSFSRWVLRTFLFCGCVTTKNYAVAQNWRQFMKTKTFVTLYDKFCSKVHTKNIGKYMLQLYKANSRSGQKEHFGFVIRPHGILTLVSVCTAATQ